MVGDGVTACSAGILVASPGCRQRPIGNGCPSCSGFNLRLVKSNFLFVSEISFDRNSSAKVFESCVVRKPEASVRHRNHQIHIFGFGISESGQQQSRQEEDDLTRASRKCDGKYFRKFSNRPIAPQYSGGVDHRAEEARTRARSSPDIFACRRQSRNNKSSNFFKRRLTPTRVHFENVVDVIGRRAAQPIVENVDKQ